MNAFKTNYITQTKSKPELNTNYFTKSFNTDSASCEHILQQRTKLLESEEGGVAMATIHQDFETPAKMALSIARNASPESTGKEIVSNSPIIYIEEIYIVSENNRNNESQNFKLYFFDF